MHLSDAYCHIVNNEVYLKSMFIAEYSFGNINNHETRRDRKLLLRKSEVKKLVKKINEKGFTVIPYKVYFSERGFAKVEIFIAQGKQGYDKRQTMKDRDSKRDLDRIKKMHG
jgi:SsrA-binding protein